MVKVNAGSLSTMASTVSNASASRSSALSQAMSSFNGLLSEGNLKGKAYDSARNYSSNVLIPLLQGMILYTEALGENASELETLYASYCGGESLDSEDLERDIQSYESSLRSAQNMCRLLEKDPTATHSMVSSSRAYATKLQADLTDLREKLRHLYAFNNASSSVFSDMADDPKKSNDLASMISGGISQVSTDFASFSASTGFPRRDKTKMGWSKDISKQWKQRNELIDAYKAATEKLKKGKTLSKDEAEAIRKYAKKYPAANVPDYMASFFETYGINNVKAVYNKGTSYGSLTRNLVMASRIKNKGNAIILEHGSNTTGSKIINKVFGLEKEFDPERIKKGYDYSYITKDNGQKINKKYRDTVKNFGMDTEGQLYNGGKTNLKSFGKTLKTSVKTGAKSGLKSGLSVGITDAVDAFKNGGKVAKGVALLNVASAITDVTGGYTETHNLALSKGIKAGSIDYYQAEAGGIAIDVSKSALTTAASMAAGTAAAAGVGVVATALGAVSAPVWAPIAASVAAGFLVTKGINAIDDKFKITKSLKNLWTGFVKG